MSTFFKLQQSVGSRIRVCVLAENYQLWEITDNMDFNVIGLPDSSDGPMLRRQRHLNG